MAMIYYGEEQQGWVRSVIEDAHAQYPPHRRMTSDDLAAYLYWLSEQEPKCRVTK